MAPRYVDCIFVYVSLVWFGYMRVYIVCLIVSGVSIYIYGRTFKNPLQIDILRRITTYVGHRFSDERSVLIIWLNISRLRQNQMKNLKVYASLSSLFCSISVKRRRLTGGLDISNTLRLFL